jgi:hypothetical protein
MKVLRKVAAYPGTKDLVLVDSTGESFWIPEDHGEFVVIVGKTKQKRRTDRFGYRLKGRSGQAPQKSSTIVNSGRMIEK